MRVFARLGGVLVLLTILAVEGICGSDIAAAQTNGDKVSSFSMQGLRPLY